VLLLAVPPVVPAQPGRPGAEVAHMQQVATEVDGWSVMTYDWSVFGPGPNAPLRWQEENVQALLADVLPAAAAASPGAAGARPVRELCARCGLALAVCRVQAAAAPRQCKVPMHHLLLLLPYLCVCVCVRPCCAAVPGERVFMGINFYGYDFAKPENKPHTASAITGDAFVQMLRRVKPKLVWEDETSEHRVRYKEAGVRHSVYSPTPAALAARVQLAEQLGVGLSIWELGQGMDVFMDLL
jgi:spore germination protein YaaH